jgi:hypothetical protein
MVRRDHLHVDDVFERRFARERLLVLEVVEMSAMHHTVIVIIRKVGVHGVERHQREAESHEGIDHEREATHAASLSSAPRAAPALCIAASAYGDMRISTTSHWMFAKNASMYLAAAAPYSIWYECSYMSMRRTGTPSAGAVE